jgi:hypothetical protein
MVLSFVQNRSKQLAHLLTTLCVALTVPLCSANTISQGPGAGLTPK